MTKLKLAIFTTLMAIGFHAYLTWTYYPLKFARSSGESFCNINSTFNCDAVAASSFSSLWGIPMSAWGLTTNLIFLFLLVVIGARLTDDKARATRNAIYLAFFIAATSLIMGIISALYLKSLCLFCIGTYICSFLSLYFVWDPKCFEVSGIKKDLGDIFSSNKTFLILLLTIPALSLVINTAMLSQYGGENLSQIVNSSISEWNENTKNDLDVEPSLTLGPSRSEAKMVISEFADFLCGHCKYAAPTLHAFAHSHPDVKLEFYSFALDGECNEAVSQAVGAPCTLAKANYCGGKTNRGWEIHNLIFANQNKFYDARSSAATLEALKDLVSKASVNWEELLECINDEKTLEIIKLQAKIGDESGVKGTPTVYANGKKLPRGQLLPVLEGLYKFITKHPDN